MPATFPATVLDRMNDLLRMSADQQITISLWFDGQIIEEILEQAMQLSLDMFPVLHCRYVAADEPYWERVEMTSPLLAVVDCSNADRETLSHEWITESGDRSHAPMVRAKLFRGGGDLLCVKISHLCSDARGLIEYIELLASIYSRLVQGETADVIVREWLHSKETRFRDHGPLFEATGVTDPRSAMKQDADHASLWAFPSNPDENDQPRVTIRRIGQTEVGLLAEYARQCGATINDVLLAAYFRVLARQAVYAEPRTEEKAVGMTVDLRRYLAKRTTSMICNMSGMEMPAIVMKDRENFSETLGKVRAATSGIKEGMPGLSSVAGMALMATMPLSQAREALSQQIETAKKMKMALPLMTNFGKINADAIRFGAAEPVDGHMTAPIMYAPFFSVGVSSYRNVLTLSIGYHTPAVSTSAVSQLLEDMVDELISLS